MDGPIGVMDLFSGIGGFRVACDKFSAGKGNFQTTWACDNSKAACRVYADMFGREALAEGDAADCVERYALPDKHLLVASLPPKIAAGNPMAGHFGTTVAAIRKAKPLAFVIEHVRTALSARQGSYFRTLLTELAAAGDYMIEWRLLNAKDFGLPQHRERVFLIGVNRKEGSQSVRLASSDDLRDLLGRQVRGKKLDEYKGSFGPWGALLEGGIFVGGKPPFTSALPPKKLADVILPEVPAEYDFTESTIKRIEAGRVVGRKVNGVEVLHNRDGGKTAGYAVYGTNGLSPTLTPGSSRHYERYKVGDRYRRLAPEEYARLQGFDDDHCRAVPANDRYALFAGGTVPVMAAWVIDRVLGLDG